MKKGLLGKVFSGDSLDERESMILAGVAQGLLGAGRTSSTPVGLGEALGMGMQGGMIGMQQGREVARQRKKDKMLEDQLQIQKDTQKQNQDYRNQMLDLQKMKMQMPQIQPMFNNVTGDLVGYDKRTGQAFNIPIGGGGASMGGQMGGMGGGGVSSPLSPKAQGVFDENMAKSQAERATTIANLEANLPNLTNVVKKLDDLGQKATYTLAGQGMDWVQRQFGGDVGEDANARSAYLNTVRTELFPMLKATFGAQFTAEEGRRLENTLGNIDASPQEKRAALQAFIEQKYNELATLQRAQGMPQNVPPIPDLGSPAQNTGGAQNPNAQPQDWRATNPDDLMRQFNIRQEELQ